MVPNGWLVKPLSDITKWSSGGTPSKSNPEFWNGNIPWISAASMRGLYYSDSEVKITELAVTKKAKMAPENSLLLLVRGSMLWNKIPVGITTRKVAFNQDVKCLEPNVKKTNSEFLLYWFLTNEHRLMNMVTGTGIGAGKLDTTDLQNLDIYLPPLPEQRKIAKILSTWDQAITTTEKLIATSQQQKKALMQQLLTGNKRLVNPETGMVFEGDWEKKSFKNILKLDRGSSPRPIINYITECNDGVNWIKIGDTKGNDLFINSTKQKITKEGAKKSRKVSIGEIIVSNSMSYGKPYILNIDGYIHDGWFVIRNYENDFNINFLLQLLGSELIQSQYKRLAAGGVVSNISSELVYSVKVTLPSLFEQKKIASVLTAADKEIELLDAKLAHLKQEKKALMQQLLTGKKRVSL